jgi:hypothetical protein
LLVEGDIANGAYRAYIDRGGFHFDLRARLRDGAAQDFRYRHAHELPEFGLMIGGDINLLHKDLRRINVNVSTDNHILRLACDEEELTFVVSRPCPT